MRENNTEMLSVNREREERKKYQANLVTLQPLHRLNAARIVAHVVDDAIRSPFNRLNGAKKRDLRVEQNDEV